MPKTITIGETEYIELWGQGYPQETISQQATEATRTYLVAWADRFQARLDFLGYSYLIPVYSVNAKQVGTTLYSIARVVPDYHPGYLRWDGSPYLYADSVTFEPFGLPLNENGEPYYGEGATIDEDNEPVYGYAKVTVHYSSRLYRIYDDDEMNLFGAIRYLVIDESTLYRYIEVPFAVASQYLTLPDGTFKFANDGTNSYDINGNPTGIPAGTTAAGAPGKVDSQWDVTMVWRQVPRRMIAAAAVVGPYQEELGIVKVQKAAFDYAIGRVNIDTFAGYPAGTLLCEAPELQQWVQADGEIVFDVTFHFKYYANGWNYFLQKNPANELVYSQISSDGGYYPDDNSGQYPAANKMMYGYYPFNYLFYGYDFTAGCQPL